MSSHTPGPWTNVRDEFVEAADGTIIVTEISGHGAPQREANARLIAAAPDLLAALKTLLERVDCDPFRDIAGVPSGIQRAKNAIEKAEGT